MSETSASVLSRPLRIALLTQEPDNYSNRSMIKAAEVRGHRIEPIPTGRCYMSINADKPEVYFESRPLPRYDAVIPRIGSRLTFYGMAVVRQFEAMDVFTLNSAQAIGNSRDKLLAHQILARRGIPTPHTAFARSFSDSAAILEVLGGAPVIIKLLESTQGKGVILAKTKDEAMSLIDAFRGLDANFLVQEFVKEANGADLRCLVVNGKVCGAMIRQGAPGEFRSNLHQGGTAKTRQAVQRGTSRRLESRQSYETPCRGR